MNVVFGFRVFIASMLSIFLLVTPRVLRFFGLNDPYSEALVSPWATFLLILIIGFIVILPVFKRKILGLVLAIGLFILAFGLTFYFCNLTFPW